MSSESSAITQKGASTRERILKSARERLIDHGIERFTLREIADTLGIKLGNLQYYFRTREILILRVMEDEAARDRAIIRSHEAQSANPTEAFAAIMRDLTSRWRGESGILFSTLSTLAIHSPAYKEMYRSIYADFYVALAAPLRAINPNLPETELALRVRLITALIDGAAMQPLTGNKRMFFQRVQAQAEAIARA